MSVRNAKGQFVGAQFVLETQGVDDTYNWVDRTEEFITLLAYVHDGIVIAKSDGVIELHPYGIKNYDFNYQYQRTRTFIRRVAP